MTFVETLEPQALWQHFDQILTIPRGSGNEAALREHIIGIAKRNGLEYQVDGVGNLLVRKPGSSGKENAPAVVLQNHLDMVNEKNSDVEHDFETDAIKPERDGDYLKAAGTTLGADNGIGAAAALALLEATDLVHGPIEALFTIEEETGLIGAADLDASDDRGPAATELRRGGRRNPLRRLRGRWRQRGHADSDSGSYTARKHSR